MRRTRSKRSASTPPYTLITRAGAKRATVEAATQPAEPVSSSSHTTRATL